MGVGIQREGGVGVAQDTGQGFGIYAAGEGVGGEGVTQIMEADAGAASSYGDKPRWDRRDLPASPGQGISIG